MTSATSCQMVQKEIMCVRWVGGGIIHVHGGDDDKVNEDKNVKNW